MTQTVLTEWAARKITWVRRWAILYWTLYTWFSAISWMIAILIPTASAITLYVDERQQHFWSVVILAAGGGGLLLQVLANILRLRERSLRGRHMANMLEGALLKYQSGLIQEKEFMQNIEHFLDEDYQEEGP